MLSEKIGFLLKFLGTSNKEIASYAECSPSNFSRLKSGKRTLMNDSVTVHRFAKGVYLYSAHNLKLEHLCAIIHCANTDEKEVISSICEWLFQENDLIDGENTRDVSPIMFGQRIKQLMSLVGISSSKFSKKLNVDASYISRMRSGERIPRYNSKLISKFCKYAVISICEQDKLEELGKIVGMPLETYNESEVTEIVKNYLYSSNSNGILMPVRNFIEDINGLTINYPDIIQQTKIGDYYELLKDTETKYIGLKGLQRAVLRLLANASAQGHTQLLLYSDQNMDWLYGDFKDQWFYFMHECAKNGVTTTIIHNLDRSEEELFYAMHAWFPLYLTGMIRSYYCEASPGVRFANTMFINCGNSCIEGHCVRGTEDTAEYHYITDEGSLKNVQAEFEVLLQNSKPLVIISPDQAERESGELCLFGDLKIDVSKKRVTIERTEAPAAKLSFDHPVICRAFAEFVKSVKD